MGSSTSFMSTASSTTIPTTVAVCSDLWRVLDLGSSGLRLSGLIQKLTNKGPVQEFEHRERLVVERQQM